MIGNDWLFIHLDTHTHTHTVWLFMLETSWCACPVLWFYHRFWSSRTAFVLCQTLFDVCLKSLGNQSGFDWTSFSMLLLGILPSFHLVFVNFPKGLFWKNVSVSSEWPLHWSTWSKMFGDSCKWTTGFWRRDKWQQSVIKKTHEWKFPGC